MKLSQMILKLAIIGQLLGLCIAVNAQEIVSQVKVIHETLEIDIPKADGTFETIKVEISKTRPETLEELVAAEKWLEAEELKAPSDFRMAIDKFGSTIFDRFKKIIRKGPEVQNIQIDNQIAADTAASAKKLPFFQSLAKKKSNFIKKVENKAEEKSKRLAADLRIGKRRLMVTQYDLWLAKYRFFGNGIGYTAALYTTMELGPALVIASGMAFLSSTVQVFSNDFGNWLERKNTAYKIASVLLMPADILNNKVLGSEFISKTTEFLKAKTSYYSKYVVFEGVFVSALYGLLTSFGHQPDEHLLLFLALKVPLATVSQGLLEEYFLIKRGLDRKIMPEIGARVRYSTKLFIVSILTNSAIALSSLSPEVSWVGDSTLYVMGGTGIALFANYAGLNLKNISTGIKSSFKKISEQADKSLLSPITNALETKQSQLNKAVSESTYISLLAMSCKDLLDKAIPPPPVLPGITVPGN